MNNFESMRSRDSAFGSGRQRKNILKATAGESFSSSDTTFDAVLVTAGVSKWNIGDTVEVKNYLSQSGAVDDKLLIWAYDDGTFELLPSVGQDYAVFDFELDGTPVGGPGSPLLTKFSNEYTSDKNWFNAETKRFGENNQDFLYFVEGHVEHTFIDERPVPLWQRGFMSMGNVAAGSSQTVQATFDQPYVLGSNAVGCITSRFIAPYNGNGIPILSITSSPTNVTATVWNKHTTEDTGPIQISWIAQELSSYNEHIFQRASEVKTYVELRSDFGGYVHERFDFRLQDKFTRGYEQFEQFSKTAFQSFAFNGWSNGGVWPRTLTITSPQAESLLTVVNPWDYIEYIKGTVTIIKLDSPNDFTADIMTGGVQPITG